MTRSRAATGRVKKAREERLDRRRQQAREEIVEAARAVLLRDGVDGLTVDAVAHTAGMTKQGLYYHFRSLEAVVAAVSLQEWSALARKVDENTRRAGSGGEALEALVRTIVMHYKDDLQLFRLVTQQELAKDLPAQALEPVRPLNDLLYGPTETKLRADQRAGIAPQDLDPRRLAVLAHAAAWGLLAMKLMVESLGDPLKHSDDDLVDELCRSFRRSAESAR